MTEANKDELIPVESIPQFAAMVEFWFNQNMARLDNLLQIPEGTGVVLEEDGIEESVVLEGDALNAFKAALLTFKADFNLPFKPMNTEPFDAPSTPQVQ